MLGVFDKYFEEEETYFKKERKEQIEECKIGEFSIKLKVVGEHSLWGNYIWNASRCISKKFIEDKNLVKDKTVLELGAGAALPSIISTLCGAKFVCATDYPEEKLIKNIEHNVENNLSEKLRKKIKVLPYFWNEKTKELLDKCKIKFFDIIILSDLIFNHEKHIALVETCIKCGKKGSTKIYIIFSHHIPCKKKYDLQIFDVLNEYKIKYKKLGEYKYNVMFPEDPGDLETRKTVYLYECEL